MQIHKIEFYAFKQEGSDPCAPSANLDVYGCVIPGGQGTMVVMVLINIFLRGYSGVVELVLVIVRWSVFPQGIDHLRSLGKEKFSSKLGLQAGGSLQNVFFSGILCHRLRQPGTPCGVFCVKMSVYSVET